MMYVRVLLHADAAWVINETLDLITDEEKQCRGGGNHN